MVSFTAEGDQSVITLERSEKGSVFDVLSSLFCSNHTPTYCVNTQRPASNYGIGTKPKTSTETNPPWQEGKHRWSSSGEEELAGSWCSAVEHDATGSSGAGERSPFAVHTYDARRLSCPRRAHDCRGANHDGRWHVHERRRTCHCESGQSAIWTLWAIAGECHVFHADGLSCYAEVGHHVAGSEQCWTGGREPATWRLQRHVFLDTVLKGREQYTRASQLECLANLHWLTHTL